MLQGLLQRFSADSQLDEILVNGTAGMALVGRRGTAVVDSPFADASALAMWLQDFAYERGERLDPLAPTVGGTLSSAGSTRPSSFRWHAVLPPLSPEGPLFSLRRHRFGVVELKSFRGETAVVEAAVASGHSILISGPTGAGKTTFLAALLTSRALHERVVIAESLQELPALSPTWIRLAERRPNLEGYGAVSITQLVQEAMRLRPDRLIIGEIRGGEAAAFLDALTTGHQGVMATIHAGSPEQARERLAALAGQTWKTIAQLLGGAPLVFVHLERGDPPQIAAVTSFQTECGRTS